MNLEILKISGALLFFFLTLVAILWLSNRNIIDGKSVVILLMGMLGVMAVLLGVGINWKNLTTKPLSTKGDEKGQNFAYCLKINKIFWKHYYYENYNFKGEIEYFVENISDVNLVDLPPDKAGWFGWDIKYSFDFKVYGNDRGFYTIDKHYFSESKTIRRELNGSEKQVTLLNWQFRVDPPIPPKKALHYGLIIETENTEKEAFTESGSFAGMSSPFPIDTMASEIYAPTGYQFINKGFILRDRAGKNYEGKGNLPEFSDDGKKITWTIEKPIPTLQYLIRIVLAKRS